MPTVACLPLHCSPLVRYSSVHGLGVARRHGCSVSLHYVAMALISRWYRLVALNQKVSPGERAKELACDNPILDPGRRESPAYEA